MAILESVICIGTTAICKIVARRFYSFMEAAALDVIPRVVRAIPVVTILSEAGSRRSWRGGLNARCREQ
jgi:hypothetical protein